MAWLKPETIIVGNRDTGRKHWSVRTGKVYDFQYSTKTLYYDIVDVNRHVGRYVPHANVFANEAAAQVECDARNQ